MNRKPGTLHAHHSAALIFASFSEATEGPEDSRCGELGAAGVLVWRICWGLCGVITASICFYTVTFGGLGAFNQSLGVTQGI